MFTFIAVFHIIVSLVMIGFILLQDPKGGSPLGMLGTGGSKSLFGNAGANQFLVSVTKWSAVIFVCTSIYLAVLSHQGGDSIMDEEEDYTENELDPNPKNEETEEEEEVSPKEEDSTKNPKEEVVPPEKNSSSLSTKGDKNI